MNKDYPVGKAQKMVLNALGAGHITGFQEAEDYFKSIGIIVNSERVGRGSVPVVTRRNGGSFNAYGEGDSWSGGSVDFSKISQWMSK